MGTYIITAIIAVWVILSIRSVIKNRNEGCGGSCSGCSKTACSSNLYEAYRKDHKKPAGM